MRLVRNGCCSGVGLLGDSPSWFRNLYISKGEAFRRLVSKNTWLKPEFDAGWMGVFVLTNNPKPMNETLTNFRQAVADSTDLQKIKAGADRVNFR